MRCELICELTRSVADCKRGPVLSLCALMCCRGVLCLCCDCAVCLCTDRVTVSLWQAATEGRVLILEGIEKAERNVLPVLNNLLENREMQLEDGRFLVAPGRYDRPSCMLGTSPCMLGTTGPGSSRPETETQSLWSLCLRAVPALCGYCCGCALWLCSVAALCGYGCGCELWRWLWLWLWLCADPARRGCGRDCAVVGTTSSGSPTPRPRCWPRSSSGSTSASGSSRLGCRSRASRATRSTRRSDRGSRWARRGCVNAAV